MKQTTPITVKSLGDFEIALTCLTVKEVEKLLLFKESYFSYIKKILESISTLDSSQLTKISIQDAMSLLVYYRMYFWDDIPVATMGGTELKPSDFIRNDRDVAKDTLFQIGDYNFSPFITLDKAIKAEKLAISSNSFRGNIRRYLLAGGCTKGIQEGIKTLNELEANPVNLGKIIAYTDAIKALSSIDIDLNSESGSINIVATKGGEFYTLGFRGSQFFTFWL